MAPFREIPDVDFSFLDATDARTDELIPFKEKFYSRKLAKLCKGRPLTDGEIACFASHFRAWQKCVDLNEAIIVCEDDIMLIDSINVTRARINEIKNSPYEYVRFMGLKPRNKRTARSLHRQFVIDFSGLSGAQAYYLTPQAASKFLSKAEKWFTPVDDYMDMYYVHNVPIITVEPFLVSSSELQQASDIAHPPSNKKRKLSPTKITSEIFRIYLSLKKAFWLFSRRKNFS